MVSDTGASAKHHSKRAKEITQSNESCFDYSRHTGAFTRATQSTATCRPETGGRPPMSRRLREICHSDVTHTHSPYLWIWTLSTMLELEGITAVGARRELKK